MAKKTATATDDLMTRLAREGAKVRLAEIEAERQRLIDTFTGIEEEVKARLVAEHMERMRAARTKGKKAR